MRLLVSAVVAIIVTGLLFTMMNALVSSPSRIDKGVDNQSIIDFVRLKQDSKTQTKNRDKKEPPKPKKPDLPPTESIQQSNDVSQMNIDMPDVDMNMDLSGTNLLGDAVVSMGMGDGDVVPLVRMPAQYPRKAQSRKIEGYVKARLTINAEGTVDKVEIIDSKPKGIFERSAIKALYKYKFRPKMQDGKAVAQVATQTVEYTLDK